MEGSRKLEMQLCVQRLVRVLPLPSHLRENRDKLSAQEVNKAKLILVHHKLLDCKDSSWRDMTGQDPENKTKKLRDMMV